MKKILLCLTILTLFSFCSCSNTDVNNGLSLYSYANSDKYLASSSFELDGASTIDVDWINSKIDVYSVEGLEKIKVTETYNSTEEEYMMHYFVDGLTCNIKFAEDKAKFKFDNYKKPLKIEIPTNCKLDQLKINTMSSNIMIHNLDAKTVDLDVMSGNMNVYNCGIRIINSDSMSGDLLVSEINGLEKVKYDSMSGNLNLSINKEQGVNLDFDTMSGKLTSNLLSTHNEKYKDGSLKVNANTMSGDVTILGK